MAPKPAAAATVSCATGSNQLAPIGGGTNLGGRGTSSVAAVSWDKASHEDAFVRGLDGALWTDSGFGSTWTGWSSLGGGIKPGTSPAVASWGPGRLDVFVDGNDNQLWHRPFAGYWGGWEPLGGYLTSSPAAASWGLNRIDIFVRGGDYGTWQKTWANGWSGWSTQGGWLSGAPGVESQSSGHLDVFAPANGTIWETSLASGTTWTGYREISGGPAQGDLTASSCAPGHVAVASNYSPGSGATAWAGGSWSSWGPIAIGTGPGLATASGYLDIFTVYPDGSVVTNNIGATS